MSIGYGVSFFDLGPRTSIENYSWGARSSPHLIPLMLKILRRLGELRVDILHERNLYAQTGGWVQKSSFSDDKAILKELDEQRSRITASNKALQRTIEKISTWLQSTDAVNSVSENTMTWAKALKAQIESRIKHISWHCANPTQPRTVPYVADPIPLDFSEADSILTKLTALAGLREVTYFLWQYHKTLPDIEIKVPLIQAIHEQMGKISPLIEEVERAKKRSNAEGIVKIDCFITAVKNRWTTMYADLKSLGR